MRGWVDHVAGIPVPTRFKASVNVATSIRAGSGTNTTWDGTDGSIVSNGAGAEFVFTDRTTPTNVGIWYRDAGLIRLYSGEAGDLWQISPTTGLIQQPALSALSANTNITVGVAGWQTPGTRLIKPSGLVYAILSFTAHANIAAGYQPLGMNSAHAPSANYIPTTWRVNAGAVPFSSGYITSSGQIFVDNIINNGDTWECVVVYSQAQ